MPIVEMGVSLKELRKAYRSKNRAYTRTLRLLELDWPCADELIDEMLQWFGASTCISNTPIVYRAINEGLHRYSKHISSLDPERLNYFVEGAISSLSRDFEEQSICMQDGSEVWSILSGESLSEFIERAGEMGIRFVKSNQKRNVIEEHLTIELVPESIIKIIEGINEWAP